MTAVQEKLEFEGNAVDQVQIRITNAGDGLSEALKITPKVMHIGDEVAILLRGTVSQINHKEGKDEQLVRVHTVKAYAATEIEEDMATRILAAAAENLARKKAAIDGQLELEQSGYLEGQEAVADLAERKAKKAAAGGSAVPAPDFSGPTT